MVGIPSVSLPDIRRDLVHPRNACTCLCSRVSAFHSCGCTPVPHPWFSSPLPSSGSWADLRDSLTLPLHYAGPGKAFLERVCE